MFDETSVKATTKCCILWIWSMDENQQGLFDEYWNYIDYNLSITPTNVFSENDRPSKYFLKIEKKKTEWTQIVWILIK